MKRTRGNAVAVLALAGFACLQAPPTTPTDAAIPDIDGAVGVIDAGGSDGADPCRDVAADGCQLFTCAGSSSCYRLCLAEVAFAVATEICAPDGKVLETETRSELDCAHERNLSSMWIGLVQDDGAVELDEGWSWRATGLVPEETYWGEIEPTDADNTENGYEQCALLQITTGEWADVKCEDAIATAACEIDSL